MIRALLTLFTTVFCCCFSTKNELEEEEELKRCLHFYNGQAWTRLSVDQILAFFREDLKAEEEIITFSEIRKTNLNCIPGWFGNWHEYTIVKTTNWFWSFEKDKTGIFVQRSKTIDGVRHSYGGQKRKYQDGPEGRSNFVSNGENIVDVVKWIINRGELNNTYQFIRGNHFFASLLYEAITRTEGRRLENTE